MNHRLALVALAAVLTSHGPARADSALELQAAQKALAAGDFAAAYPQYLRAAQDEGNPLAQFTLALFYQEGWGRPADAAQACFWQEKAAAGGIPAAAHAFADCLAQGIGRPPEPAQAAVWYEKAANLGHHVSWCSLGELYVAGKGVPKDPAKGAALCRRAAEQGSVPAQLRLAHLLMEGDEAIRDLDGAFRWLQYAAQGNSPEAQYSLGVLLRDGLGRPPDLGTARYWFESAATQGYVPAYFPTAVLYARAPVDPGAGKLQAEDLARAYLWLSATAKRSTDAKELEQTREMLAEVRKVMPETWLPALDKKVARHLAEHPALPIFPTSKSEK